MGLREELGKDVGDILFRGDIFEDNKLGEGLFTELRHADTEVPVARGHDVVLYHGDSCLVVFVDGGGGNGETDFTEESTQPQDILDAFVGGDEFGSRSTLTNHSGGASGPGDATVGEEDHVPAAGAVSSFITVSGVNERGGGNGTEGHFVA